MIIREREKGEIGLGKGFLGGGGVLFSFKGIYWLDWIGLVGRLIEEGSFGGNKDKVLLSLC